MSATFHTAISGNKRRNINEKHAGFQPTYTIIQIIVYFKHLQRKYQSKRRGIFYLTFVDFQKALATVDISKRLYLLGHCGQENIKSTCASVKPCLICVLSPIGLPNSCVCAVLCYLLCISMTKSKTCQIYVKGEFNGIQICTKCSFCFQSMMWCQVSRSIHKSVELYFLQNFETSVHIWQNAA